MKEAYMVTEEKESEQHQLVNHPQVFDALTAP